MKNVERFRTELVETKYMCLGIIRDGIKDRCNEVEDKQLRSMTEEIKQIHEMNDEQLVKKYAKEYESFIKTH